MDRKGFIKQSGSLLLLTSLNKLGMHQHQLTNPQNIAPQASKSFCTTCGTQFPPGQPLPDLCPICNDDRQYINDKGQTYITPDELNKQYSVKISKINEQLYTIKMIPDFAIGQRAFLVISPGGNVLWDCIPLLNEAIIAFIKSKGGLKAIAFSHPHYYSNMNEWAAEFNCPVFIHEDDKEWIQYKSNYIQLWDGETKPLWDNISIINIGGHFPGSSVLYLPAQSAKGTLLSGDTLYIAHSKRHVAVMHSYPNQILLTKKEFASVYKKSAGIEFDTMRGAFEGQELTGNAKEIFEASMKRYLNGYEL
jgi:hypothetical protein